VPPPRWPGERAKRDPRSSEPETCAADPGAARGLQPAQHAQPQLLAHQDDLLHRFLVARLLKMEPGLKVYIVDHEPSRR